MKGTRVRLVGSDQQAASDRPRVQDASVVALAQAPFLLSICSAGSGCRSGVPGGAGRAEAQRWLEGL